MRLSIGWFNIFNEINCFRLEKKINKITFQAQKLFFCERRDLSPPFQLGSQCDPVEIGKAKTCPGELSGYNKEVGLSWFVQLGRLQAHRGHN